jgi:predicted acetyltransferase
VDFTVMLPKLYKREYFMDSIHYLAREGGKIKAVVGAFPLKIEFSGGTSVPGRGIGSVSVHPRSRSKGYMKALMNMALEEMKSDGMVFSCLGGQRQRYEYFGFTPAGTNYNFTVQEANITHTLGKEWKSDLSLKNVNAGDKEILARIMELHESKIARYFRGRDRFFDILSSWHSKIFAFTEGEKFEGYFFCRADHRGIVEINLKNPSRICEAIGVYRKEMNNYDSVRVAAGPHEAEKVTILSQFAERCHQSPAYQFNVLDFKRFVGPFLKIKSQQQIIAEGSFVLKINGPAGGTYELSSRSGEAEIRETASAPDLVLDPLEATRFFFSPVSAITNQKIRERIFLQSLLPLPLFFENIDGI